MLPRFKRAGLEKALINSFLSAKCNFYYERRKPSVYHKISLSLYFWGFFSKDLLVFQQGGSERRPDLTYQRYKTTYGKGYLSKEFASHSK